MIRFGCITQYRRIGSMSLAMWVFFSASHWQFLVEPMAIRNPTLLGREISASAQFHCHLSFIEINSPIILDSTLPSNYPANQQQQRNGGGIVLLNKRTTPPGLRLLDNGTLLMHSSRKSHQGRYTCRAFNSLGQELIAIVSVTVHGKYQPILSFSSQARNKFQTKKFNNWIRWVEFRGRELIKVENIRQSS